VCRGHIKELFHAEFSPDGRRIVSHSLDGIDRSWDSDSGAFLEVIPKPKYEVADVREQSPLLAVARGDEVVIEFKVFPRRHHSVVWFPAAIDHRQPLPLLPHPSGRIWAGVSLDRLYVYIISLEGQTP
jgi:WD40 repeat protein